MAFPPKDVRARLAAAQSLPEAVMMLREAAGSHDKLGAILGTSRQTIIRWEQGAWPGRFIDKLRALGVPPALLTQDSRSEVEQRLRAVEAEVEKIRRLLR